MATATSTKPPKAGYAVFTGGSYDRQGALIGIGNIGKDASEKQPAPPPHKPAA